MKEVNSYDGVLVKMNLIKVEPNKGDNEKGEIQSKEEKKSVEQNSKAEGINEQTYTENDSMQSGNSEVKPETKRKGNKTTERNANIVEQEEEKYEVHEEDYGLTSNDESTVVQNKDINEIYYDKVMTGQQELPKEAESTTYNSQVIEIDDKISEEEQEITNNTVEDDENTINSGQTNRLGRKDQSNTTLPVMVRFQITILLDQEDE